MSSATSSFPQFPVTGASPARARASRTSRRWAMLSGLVTVAVVASATVIGVDLGATGAASTPVPQAVAAAPVTTGGAGAGDLGFDHGGRGGGHR